MSKFSATKITDLISPAYCAGRVARGCKYVTACEASDGSWCEFDADTLLHASLLADNAVDKLGARGCSCWAVEPDGSYSKGPSLYHVYAQPQEDDMRTKLPYVVECKSTYPFFEQIAAFDCEPPAAHYAADCKATNPTLEYRVVKK